MHDTAFVPGEKIADPLPTPMTDTDERGVMPVAQRLYR
jgi:hypothetical protein